MNRRQSLDKPAILSPPVQFIVPSPTASASPSPSPHGLLPTDTLTTTRRLSTGSNHQHQQQYHQQGGGGSSSSGSSTPILLRQSPSQSPSHNIIFTNGPATTQTAQATPPPPIHGLEFNTTLVGSNNIALNVKRNGGGILSNNTIFVGPSSATSSLSACNSPASSMLNANPNLINSRRATISPAGVHGTYTGGSGGGGGGGVSPKPGKRPVTFPQSSPVPSPVASPTALKQNTPNQSPIHQIPILTSHTTGQPMYQIIQTSAGTQQLIQSGGGGAAAIRQANNLPTTFHAPPTLIQQHQPLTAQQQQILNVAPPPLQHVKHKGPQQILPKPATGIGTVATCSAASIVISTSSSSSQQQHQQMTTTSSSKGMTLNKVGGINHNVTTSTSLPASAVVSGLPQVSNGVPLTTSTILTQATMSTATNAMATGGNPILLPTAQPLIMSTNQMPVLVQQNTPQGVQFILRQPTNQLASAPIVLHQQATAGGARTQSLSQGHQPQQLLRIVNGNGQVQFSPTTFIMSSQGNIIQQLQAGTATTASTQQQLKAPTEIQQKLNPIHLGQALNGNLVQMSTGQFISQFPAQNFNFANVNQLMAAPNVTFATTSSGSGGGTGTSQGGDNGTTSLSGAAGGGGGQVTGTSVTTSDQQQIGATIQFNNVIQQPGMHHQFTTHQQQQIISPIASPALGQTHQQQQQSLGDLVILQQQQQQNQGVVVETQHAVVNQQQQQQVKSKSTPVKKATSVVNSSSVTVSNAASTKKKKETKKEKAAKASAAASKKSVVTSVQVAPIVVAQPQPPPVSEAPKGKLDLANVMALCGIGIDDDDDDDCGDMLLDTDYQPSSSTMLMGEDQQQQHGLIEDEFQQQIHMDLMGDSTKVTESHQMSLEGGGSGISGTGNGDIMITIPGMNSNESIPISFTIPSLGEEMKQLQEDILATATSTPNTTSEVITLDDDSWSPQKQQQRLSTDSNSSINSKLLDGTMCVPTFVNSVLNSQMTPTLQSQIAEIQNQLLGVTSSSMATTTTMSSATSSNGSSTATSPAPPPLQKNTATIVPTPARSSLPSPMLQISGTAGNGTKKPNSAVVKAKPARKSNSGAANKKQSSVVKVIKDQLAPIVPLTPKVIPTACGPLPSQIGNIQISQVDSSSGGAPMNKVVTSIENQIQITPIMDTGKGTNAIVCSSSGMQMGNVMTTSAPSFPGMTASSNMTVTMKTVAVNSQPQQQQHQQPQQMPKLYPTNPPQLIARPAATTTPVATAPSPAPMPTMQINLQAPPPPPNLQIPLAVQQHPLLSTLTGALSLNLMEDGRLVLKHDANAPQDAQSQMILQTILSGALANLTLVQEQSQPQQQAPVVEKPKMVQQKMVIQQQQQHQQIPQQRKAIVEPQQQQQQQQHVLVNSSVNQGNIVELPKIGPDKQLFKMNMVTNQITQISAGSTTALVGPNEQLLIVPADINPQQLAQCQAAGQLQLHNVGQLRTSQQQQQQQPGLVAQQQQPPRLVAPPQVQLKPQPVMPALVSTTATKTVITTPVTTAANNNKKGKKGAKVNETVVSKGGVSTGVAAARAQLQQNQTKQVIGNQGKATKAPILKHNVTVTKMKSDTAANTAVVRPNTIQSHAGNKPVAVATGNKLSLVAGQQQQQQTQIMQNLKKATQIVLPSSANVGHNSTSGIHGIPQPQPPQVVPRVQTIQLTPQNQQILKEVQMKIQMLSGKLKDKNLLEKLTFPIELDENNPINRQPLPTLQNCNTMTDKDIHVALQRLFIEQQKILATGKVIPMISNYPPQVAVAAQQQQQQSQQPLTSMQSNVMPVSPTVMANKFPLQAGGGNANAATAVNSTSGNAIGGGRTAEMVKNWPLMKTQQINEMTIKPIMTTSSSAMPSVPLPNKVINSTTIIPAPVGGSMSMSGSGGGGSSSAVVSSVQQGSGNKSKTMPGGGGTGEATGAMSIIPMVVPPTAIGVQPNQKQQQQSQKSLVMTGINQQGINNSSNSNGPNKVIPGGTLAGQKVVPKVERIEPVSEMKMEPVEEVVVVKQEPMGKSPQELAEIVKGIERRLKIDQENCLLPDTETPFRGKADAVMRLFGYHCNYREHEPVYPEEEQRFQKAAVDVQEGLWSLSKRYQGLLMNESMLHVSTSERLMIERILVSEIKKEITDFQEDIERLKNPEPEPPPPPTVVLDSVDRELTGNSVTTGGFSQEDDTTRTSDVTDSRSMCDVKSESGQFGWNDEWTEEENSGSMARIITTTTSVKGQIGGGIKKEFLGIKDEEGKNDSKLNHLNENFDIESEILPNFILNMKVNSGTSTEKDKIPRRDGMLSAGGGGVKMMRSSPVLPMKNENYDEWSCIQKELADLGVDNESKAKRPWMAESGTDVLQPTTVATVTGSSSIVHHSERAVVALESPVVQESVLSMEQHQMKLSTTTGVTAAVSTSSTTTTTTRGNSSHFFCMESNQSDPESWLNFQHDNNSFDFQLSSTSVVAPVTTTGTTNGHSSGQVGGGVSGSASVATQKRPWNGMLTPDTGSNHGSQTGGLLNGGGMESGASVGGGGMNSANNLDDYYGKKMCFGNGDFDFNHLIMASGGSNGAGGSHHQEHQQQHQSNPSASDQLTMDHQQSQHNHHHHHNHHNQQQHSQTFDEDINRQVQSAIDSILNLQNSSDVGDFQFNLDPAMGAFLGEAAGHPAATEHMMEEKRNGPPRLGGGLSQFGVGSHLNSSVNAGGVNPLMGNHLDGGGLSSANSAPGNQSRFAMEHQQNHNQHHHVRLLQQQHQSNLHQSSMASAMILSDDEDDDDEDDEQRRAIKSVLLS